SPSVRPALTGNATTAERWARGLEARGHACVVAGVEPSWREDDFLRAVARAAPDVVHLHHAARCGRFATAARGRATVVVSFAGTDLTADASRAIVLEAASAADVVAAGGEDPKPIVAALDPELAQRVRGIPKGVVL